MTIKKELVREKNEQVGKLHRWRRKECDRENDQTVEKVP